MKPPKPKDYPKLITVGKSIYHVVLMDKLKEGDLGGCDDGNKVILLSRAQNDSELFASFFHELLHAIEKEYRLPIGHARIRRMEYDLASILKLFLKN